MTDDRTRRGPPDAKLISLTEDAEVEYWTTKFAINRQQLSDAIRLVGASAEKVDEHLRRG